MDILLKKVRVIAPGNKYHNKRTDILIKKGKISKIDQSISARNVEIIESRHLHCSIGWVDIGSQICDPGYEHRETLQSVAAAAEAGGYTAIAPFPNVEPAVDNKSSVNYILSNTSENVVDFIPIGAMSRGCKGDDISEMVDMHAAGVIAFSDGRHSIQSGGLLLRGLQYSTINDALVIDHPSDKSLKNGGHLHEGKVSISMGTPGIPDICESSALSRNCDILSYTGGRLMVHNISCEESYKIIKSRKKNQEGLYCSVAYDNLISTDEKLTDFDPNYKVDPPLRSDDDRRSLVRGLRDGTIDVVTSNHRPLEEEAKKLEFFYAKEGSIGLETCYAALNTFLGYMLDQELLIDKLAYGPRKVLGLEIPIIEKGEMANLTIFDPRLEWTYDGKDIKSKSKNSPYIGHKFQGKVIGVVNGKKSCFDYGS